MTTPTEIYNWYKRYKVLAADMTELQSQLLDRPSGMMEGIFAGSILSGLEAATTGGMSVQVNTGLAVGPTGFFHVVDSITTVNLTAPTGSNPARSLIVARPSLTDSDYITNPTNPFDTVPLRTTLGSAITLLPGTAASSPSYPGTESNDVVICGVRTYPGQTSITVADIDLTVRDNVAKNSSGLQNAAQFDDRLRPYRLTNQILGVRPSQLSGSNQKQFKASSNNRGAIFPKTPAGAFNANDTFLNFQTGAVTGGDGATGSFTPSIPSAGNCIVATVLLTANNTLSVSYGTAGTRTQCVTGILNQTASGAGSVSIPTTGQPIAFVIVTSSNGTTVTEIDFFDARGILQGGGGAGGDPTFINYFVDPDFEATPVGTVPENFSTYNDGATAVPVDGTGGSVTGVTFLASDSSPIRGTVSGVLTKDAANRQGMGLAYTFTIPSVDKSTLALVRFELLCSTDYAAGDIVLYVYDVTNSTLITPSNTSLPDLPTNGGKHQYTFLLGTGTQYRLLWHIATTNASAYTVKFDTMVCTTTPQVVQSLPNTDWQSYTPTFSVGLGSVSTINFWWRRVNSDIEIQGSFSTGTLAGSVATFTLPNNLTVGSTAVAVRSSFGEWYCQATPSSLPVYSSAGVIIATALGANTIGFDYQAAASSNLFTPRNANTLFNNNIIVSLKCKIPIAEWAGGGVNLGPGAQVEYASNNGSGGTAAGATYSSGSVAGSLGSAFVAVNSATASSQTIYEVTFQYPIQDNDLIDLQTDFPVAGGGFVSVAGGLFDFEELSNGTTAYRYGMYWRRKSGSATTIEVVFGNGGARINSAAGSAGEAWSNYTSYKWRVRKSTASAPVGFGLAGTDGSAGLYKPGQAPGLTTGATIASGYIGERLSSNSSGSVTWTAAGTYYNVASITLTSGVWLVSGTVSFNSTTATGVQRFVTAISTSNSTPDTVGQNALSAIGGSSFSMTGSVDTIVVQTPTRYIQVSSSTPVYLLGMVNYSANSGTFQNVSQIQAVRIA